MGVKIGSVDRWSLPLHQLSCSFYFERRASFYSVQPVARGIPGEMKTTAATAHASKSSGQQQKKTLSVCADLIKRTYSPRGIPFRSSLDVISSTVSKWNECVPDTMRYRCAIFNPRARGRKIHGNRVCCCYYLFPFFFPRGMKALMHFYISSDVSSRALQRWNCAHIFMWLRVAVQRRTPLRYFTSSYSQFNCSPAHRLVLG